MKITGTIFDLDGTLIDSMKIWDVLPGKVVRSFGAEPTDDLAYQLAAMDKQEAADYNSKRGLSGRAGNEAVGSMGMFPVCAQLYAVRLQKQSANLLSGSRKNGDCSGTDPCV